MKIDFRKLLLLCSDDDSRDGIAMPFVDGDYVYATDGKIIARHPLKGMGCVPLEAGTEPLPRNAGMVFPDRPSAQFVRLLNLKLPDGQYLPHNMAVSIPCKIGNFVLSPKLLNLFWSEFSGAEFEVNAPAPAGLASMQWRLPEHSLDGVVMGLAIKNQPVWVWDMIDGGYLLLVPDESAATGWTISRTA